jgi:hypothetical protein
VSKEQGMDLNHFKQTLQAEPGREWILLQG